MTMTSQCELHMKNRKEKVKFIKIEKSFSKIQNSDIIFYSNYDIDISYLTNNNNDNNYNNGIANLA